MLAVPVTFHASASAAQIVGRERELEQLEAALDAVTDGDPAYLAVEGEAGIGKTRLLSELCLRATERGHVVLSGSAAEFERELPFSVWIDALDAYVTSQDFARSEGWDDELAAELGEVLPSVKGSNGSAGAVAEERFRAHRAVSRLLGLIAGEQPLVLVLDDLHWSDGASLELIAALARREPRAPVLFALGFRPSQAAQRLAPALTGPRASRVELQQLSESDAGLLLAGMDAGAVAAIYRHSGGNPFYLEQLGRAGEGALTALLDTAGDEADVPPAVAGAIAGELAPLSTGSRSFLDAAAVAGDPFELELAAAVAGLDEAEALAALDEALDLDLIRPTEVPRRFGFRHPLVRRSVYESARGGWRIAAHARAAEALAARGADATERAHHVERSARRGDTEAIELLLEAGRASASRAPSAAARWFAAAIRLLPSQDWKRQVSVRISLASALRSLGEFERCHQTLLDALERLPPDAAVERVDVTTRCAAIEHWMGRHDTAHDRLVRAAAELPHPDTTEAAALQIELAVDGFYERNEEQTLTMAGAALETARALGDDVLIAAAASVLCVGEAASGHIEAAREHREEAVSYVDRLSDAELAPRQEALCHLAWAEVYLEVYDKAIAHVERGIAIGRASGEGAMVIPMMLVKGFPFEMQGRLAEAREVCEEAVEATRLAGNPQWHFWSLFELGWAHYYAGHLEAAIAAGEESAEVGHRLAGGTYPSSGGGPGPLLAYARFELGEIERARKDVTTLGSDWLEHKIAVERCFDWETLALIELAMENRERAEDYAQRAEQNAERLGLRLPAALAGRTRAAVLLDAGDAEGAARAACVSAELADRIGARLQAAFSRALEGKAHAAAGERSRAVATLRDAERVLDECGSLRVRDEIRRELRQLGARAEVRGPASADDSGVGSLTKRELEIAELITDRLTNPQIAERLFLSKKTIETHIRNLFVKLGASSRVEVARIIERDRRERPGLVDAP
jgi:DNA-binding NarL/FixJ family response regulator